MLTCVIVCVTVTSHEDNTYILPWYYLCILLVYISKSTRCSRSNWSLNSKSLCFRSNLKFSNPRGDRIKKIRSTLPHKLTQVSIFSKINANFSFFLSLRPCMWKRLKCTPKIHPSVKSSVLTVRREKRSLVLSLRVKGCLVFPLSNYINPRVFLSLFPNRTAARNNNLYPVDGAFLMNECRFWNNTHAVKIISPFCSESSGFGRLLAKIRPKNRSTWFDILRTGGRFRISAFMTANTVCGIFGY